MSPGEEEEEVPFFSSLMTTRLNQLVRPPLFATSYHSLKGQRYKILLL
jgi:hypothetical protein